jgi:4-amino-4-deoxy-L-arabinose transferase-like glycosyltransferase
VRIWHLALMAAAFGTLAAGSCAGVVVHGPYPASDPYAIAFALSGVPAGGSLVLLGFRLRVGRREAWPGIRQMLLLGTASWLVMYASLIGFASIMNGPLVSRHAMIVPKFALLVTSAVAAVVTLGSAALLAVGIVRRVRSPEDAQ